MPIYDLDCPNCGEIKDIWAKMADMQMSCPQCGAETKRLISSPTVICDLEPYIDYNMAQEGVPISSKQQLKQELKDRGLVEHTPLGPKKKFYQKQRWI